MGSTITTVAVGNFLRHRWFSQVTAAAPLPISQPQIRPKISTPELHLTCSQDQKKPKSFVFPYLRTQNPPSLSAPMASPRSFIFASLLLLSPLPFAPLAASSSSKISVALYYESLCPYSANFIVNYLAKFFENGLISIIDLELIPYGNARIKPNGTITCQHGPFECLLNTVEACAISVWPDLNQHFSFIYCVESLVMQRKYVEWESCFQKTGLNSEAVLDCYENGKGEKLEFQYAEQTDSLQPPHKYVPWVVVNGQPLYEDYEDVEAYICKAYEGKLPKTCEELPLVITSEAKANQAHHLSRINEIISPLQLPQKHEV